MPAFGPKILRMQHRRNYTRMLDNFVIMYKDSNFIPSRVDVLSLAFRAFCEPFQQMEALTRPGKLSEKEMRARKTRK